MSAQPSRLKLDLFIGLALRGAGAVSSFALAWLIVQMFGARTLGLYQIGFTTATLLGTIAVLGQHVALIKAVAPLLRDDRRAEASGVFRQLRAFVAKLAMVLVALAMLGAWPLAVYGLGEEEAALFVIAISPIILTIPVLRVQNALLRCLGQVQASQSLEGVFFTSLAALVLACLWFLRIEFSALWIPLILVAGHVLAVAIGYVLVSRNLVASAPPQGKVDVAGGAAIASAPALTAAAQWLILLLIAGVLDSAQAGIFRVAVLICMLMQLVQTSFATMAGPYLSRAAEAEDYAEMRKIILVAGLIGMALASPIAVLGLFAPQWVLSLFGREFVTGALALQLLVIGELINVATGPLGIALIMQNRERQVLFNEIAANLIGLAVAVALLSTWGLAGAGAGLLVASVVRNGANAVAIWLIRPPPAMTPNP